MTWDSADPPSGKSTASPDGLPPLRDVIAAHGLDARKALGQNFILDLNLTRRIARVGGSLVGVTVVEIGPGPGGLTRALLLEGAAHVIAIERDYRCLPALEDIARAYPARLTVHHGDALEVDWTSVLAGHQNRPVRVIANLPYNIATKLLIDWLETEPWPPWFDKLVLMFQLEVAERIVAEHGSRAYGRLSIISQWRTSPRIAMKLKPEAFTPPPKVASAVVELIPRAAPEPVCTVDRLGKVTAAALGQRRKMLRSSLKSIVPFPELLLTRLGIDPTLRAEQLTIRQFAAIAAELDRLHQAP